MSIFLVLFSLLVIVCAFLWWLSKSKDDSDDFYKDFKGPPTIPLLGNALDFRSTKIILNTVWRYSQEYGGIVKVRIGPFRRFLLVSDYNAIENVLNDVNLIGKSDDYNFLMPWLGTGLLTSDGPKWKKHRRILTPAFHFQILEHFIEVFEACGGKLVQKLSKEVGKGNVNIYPFITLCSLDAICESIMGTSINAQDHEDSEYIRSVKDMCRITYERSVSPIEMYDFLYPLTKNFYTQRKALKILHKHSIEIIQARRKELETESQKSNGEILKRNKKPFLDLLLHATVDNRPLSNEEIREEVDTFLFEGHDTTASAISFTLFCLANHPRVQQKAFEEQQSLQDNKQDWTVTYEDLQNMKYLEQVIKESLRLYPSVPIVGRRTNAGVRFGNKVLPKGGTLIIFIYGIHRDPKYFKNPEEFDPSRFENMDRTFPYAYIPFSAGSRNCIGQRFAMLEMKSIISKILRKYKLGPASPKQEMKLISETILKPLDGVNISLYLRQ